MNAFLLCFFSLSVLVLFVCLHEGSEDAVLLLQQGLGPVVLLDHPPLHHNHQVGIQDGVDAMLRAEGENTIMFTQLNEIPVYEIHDATCC